MLTEKYNLSHIKKIDFNAYKPFPIYSDAKWKAIDTEISSKWIKAAETYLNYEWPAMTADMYFNLGKTGILKPHWDRFRERRSGLGMLALAECMEGGGRFMNQIINGIIAICEETCWVQALGMSRFNYEIPDESNHEVDLTTSETAALLAWIDYLLGAEIEKISKRARKRIKTEVSKRIIKPYLDNDDYWWMGFNGSRTNNWNPWCNMNVIICLLLLEDDNDVRLRGLYKVMRSLDSYVAAYSEDGCCDEGPMYWGAAGGGLYLCLELLYDVSNGALDVFENPKLRLIGQYICKTYIDGDYFVNYADGDVKAPISPTIYRFGKAIGDEGMQKLGALAKRKTPSVYDWFHAYQYLHDIFREELDSEGYYPLQSFLWKTGVMCAREKEGGKAGFFLSAKGGNNLESHNHNDIGNFIVFVNGKPLFIDIGTEEYSVKTFSKERFEIWYLRSDYHNCFQIDGINQDEGIDYFAEDVVCNQTEGKSEISMELKFAYPSEAGIISWKRYIELNRDTKTITVKDNFELEEAKEIKRFLISAVKPEPIDNGLSFNVDGEVCTLNFSPEAKITVEEIPLTESRLMGNWGDMIYRIVLTEKVKEGERVMVIKR